MYTKIARYFPIAGALVGVLILAGCHRSTDSLPGDADDSRPWSAIEASEVIHAAGTEPFWGVEVQGTRLVYSNPDDPQGTSLEVSRFAGRGGLSYSGELDGKSVTLAVTSGACSDGMSDRDYPFTATLALGDDLLHGCAWSAKHPYEKSERN